MDRMIHSIPGSGCLSIRCVLRAGQAVKLCLLQAAALSSYSVTVRLQLGGGDDSTLEYIHGFDSAEQARVS